MKHKRRRHKRARAGCLMCKPWKAEPGSDRQKDRRRWQRHEARANA